MDKSVKYIFRFFVVISAAVLLSGTVLLFLSNYEELLKIILSQTGKSHKINKFKTEYLSYEKFLVLRFTAVFINIIFWFLFFKYYKTIETKIIDFLQFIVSGIKNEIRSISKKDWKIFGVIIFITSAVKIYYFFTQPITNDEAFTFLNYVKSGFLAAVSYYNLTNNHIFHSVLCNVFDAF